MRGNPLGQLVLIVVAFALLGVPVWRLTWTAEAVSATTNGPKNGDAQSSASSSAAVPMTLTVGVDFTPAPKEFSVSYLDDVMLQGQGQASASALWKVALPAEGADLVLHVAWPSGGTNGAARVTVRSPDGKTTEKNFWSPGAANLDTVLTVPGSGP